MGTLPSATHVHHTRLRDFGAFQSDISQLPTQKMSARRVFPASLTSLETPPSVGERQHASPLISLRRLSKKKWPGFVLRVLVTGVLLFVVVRSFSWSSLLSEFSHVQHGLLLVGIVVGACGIVLSAYQWRGILRVEGIHLDLAELINLYVIGIAFSHFLPTGMGGDAVKAFYVGRKAQNNVGSTSAVLMCRVTGFCAMLLVVLPVLLIWHDFFPLDLVLAFALLSIFVSAALVGVLLCAFLFTKVLQGYHSRHSLLTLLIDIGEALGNGMERPRVMWCGILYGIVFWIVATLNCYCYAMALGIRMPLYFYFLVVPTVALVSSLPISVNGFGLRESALVYAFSVVHISSSVALLLALLLDLQALLFGAVGAWIYLIGQRNATKDSENSEQLCNPGQTTM